MIDSAWEDVGHTLPMMILTFLNGKHFGVLSYTGESSIASYLRVGMSVDEMPLL